METDNNNVFNANDAVYCDFATMLGEYSDTNFYTGISDNNIIVLNQVESNLNIYEVEKLAERVNNTLNIISKFEKIEIEDIELLKILVSSNLRNIYRQQKAVNKISKHLDKLLIEFKKIE